MTHPGGMTTALIIIGIAVMVALALSDLVAHRH